MFGIFKASDGYVYVAAEGSQVDRLKAIVAKDLETDEDLKQWIGDKTVKFVVDTLTGADVPVAPIYQINATVEDPQIKSREMIIEFEHPKAGRIRQPNFPIKFSKNRIVTRPAPVLGQDNEDILRNLLGYTDEEIATLRREGVIT
jgi:crotonobetainyl-CoA:carnitine CoA-transferase CaiB-like acyl-CoA transferase